MYSNTILRIIFILSVLLIFSCSKKKKIVAEFGKHIITLEEFRSAYLKALKKPDVFVSKKLRERFLNELINRRLFAEYAEQQGLMENEKFRLNVDAYRDKCLRDAHFKGVITPQIKIDSNEIAEVYAYSKQQRKIKHLFSETQTGADSLYNLLNKGVDWNILAQKCFTDEKLVVSGGDLDWVYWDQLEYDMAMTTFRLKPYKYSKPVKSTYGYHIIKMDNFRMNLMVSEHEEKMHRETTRFMLEQKIGDKIALEYISKKMKNVSIRVVPEMMKIVGDNLKKNIRRQPSQFDCMNEMQLTDKELQVMEQSLWNYRDEALLIIDGKPMTVGEFIYATNYIPYEALYKSFKTALDYVIRDRVISTEAKKMQLEKKYDFVNIETRLYEEYILHLNIKREIATSIKVNKEDIELEYKKRKSSQFKNLPLDSVKVYLQKQILNQKKINSISDFSKKLKDGIFVNKNLNLIHNYYDKIVKRGK
ncbi:MAG: peptidylprolyl isomerase [Calditrichia bacterium]|nr:peptidylprolyl isomerase [Calditrichia bacterium]